MQKAIVIREYGNSAVLKLEKIKVGDPRAGELFIRHTAIGVHFHDIYVRSGQYKTLSLPGIPGVEATGIVEKIGKGVSCFRPGDRIGYITSAYGAYATHRLLDQSLAVKLPLYLSDDLIATNFTRAMTAQILIEQVAKLTPDHTILVTAATGGVGRLLCQWASSLGVSVVGSVSTPEKAILAKSYGCKYALLYEQKDFMSQIMDITNQNGVDIVYDSVGFDTFKISLDTLKSCGHLVNFGQSSGPVDPLLMSTLAKKSLTVSRPIIFHYIANLKLYEKMANCVFDAFNKKIITALEPEPYNLENASVTHDILESRRGGGSLLLNP
jgi:NADPH2:quinone reductase